MIDTKKMKYGEFEDVIAQLSELVKWYGNPYFNNNDNCYTLYLSNGERIEYSFPERCVAHLLGVKTEEIKARGMFQVKSSFLLLKKICDSAYSFYTTMLRCNVTFDQVFSEFIDNKFEVFKELFNIYVGDIIFVCKYDRQLSYINGEDKKDLDYIIASEYKGKMLLLGLKKNGNTYIPETSQLLDVLLTDEDRGVFFDNEEEFSIDEKRLASFIRGQSLLLPETLLIDRGDNPKKFYLNEVSMKVKLNNLFLYRDKYDCNIDVSHYCTHVLNSALNSRNVTASLIQYWREGVYNEPVTYSKLNSQLTELIEYGKSFSGDSLKSLKKIKALMESVSSYEKQIEELTDRLNNKMREISILEEKNLHLEENNRELSSLVDDVRNLVLRKK